jgi:dTDP-4-amino-4,6-dideoxygalactose transaminase
MINYKDATDDFSMIEFFPLNRRNNNTFMDLVKLNSSIYESGKFILGEEVKKFQNNFASYVGTKYAVGVGNGLDALKLSLVAAGVKKGDWVIVPGFSFIATWLAVLDVGAVPIPVDVENKSGNICLDLVKNKMNSKVKAIVVVHLYGNPAIDLDFVSQMNSVGTTIIEDAAQAHGAEIQSIKCGNLGIISAFSFYPTKNLGATGDAGMVMTNDYDFYEVLNSISNYGRGESKYEFSRFGYNSRMDEIQAGNLNYFLNFLKNWNEIRVEIANKYKLAINSRNDDKIRHLDGILNRDVKHCYHLFVCAVEDRNDFIAYMRKQQIATEIHYPNTILDHDFIMEKIPKSEIENLPNSIKLSREVVSIPLHPWLKKEEISKIISALANY